MSSKRYGILQHNLNYRARHETLDILNGWFLSAAPVPHDVILARVVVIYEMEERE